MNGKERRSLIMKELAKAEKPISATTFAKSYDVSRQVIVGDIAILRASGENVVSTPRGYSVNRTCNFCFVLACKHSRADIRNEMSVVVECGCGIIDVVVEHSVYGQISGNMHIFTQADIDSFMFKLDSSNAVPLSSLTGDVHLHTICCPTEEHYDIVKDALRKKGFLIEESVD